MVESRMSAQSIERKIAELSIAMAAAAAAEDFEGAAALRNAIEAVTGETVRQPPPGQLGLGTNIPVAAPPSGWKRPQRPDPMTSHHKSGGRRRK
jgi:hypothetical protein